MNLSVGKRRLNCALGSGGLTGQVDARQRKKHDPQNSIGRKTFINHRAAGAKRVGKLALVRILGTLQGVALTKATNSVSGK
jgi:hypothetical protein